MKEVRFGEWLSRHRKSLGLTQKQLANKVYCATVTLRKIEAEQRHPSIQIVERLALIMNIPPDEMDSFIHFARGEKRLFSPMEMYDVTWRLSAVTLRSFLPVPLTSLIGREAEASAIESSILDGNTRLINIVGPPGIGKSRLINEVAHELIPYFSGIVGFINLAEINTPSQLPLMILQSIGIDQIIGKSPVDQLKHGIGNRFMLLVLDNLEHLVEYVCPLIYDLLQSCPHLKIITTSRVALRMAGEKIYPVPPLGTPSKMQLESLTVDASIQYPAIRLFAERASAVATGFELTNNNIKDIATICTKLDGIPLAIELIAAYIKIMSPHSLLSHLNERLVLHTKGTFSSPAYHQSIYQAIDWSYCFLSPEEQHLLNNLSVFSGGFTLEQIEEAFIDVTYKDRVTDLLASLLEKSLVQGGNDSYGEPRFNLLIVIQQFASEKLADSGEEFIAHQRHLDYFYNYSQFVYREIRGQNHDKWMDHLDTEQNNLRAALNWCISSRRTESALFILTVLSRLWSLQGNYNEMSCWFGMIQTLPDFHEHISGNDELSALLEGPDGGSSEYKNTISVIGINNSGIVQ